MHFAASDGSGSVSIWDHYDVDESVEVSGQTSASFGGGLSLDDSRRISGPGNVYVVQGYTGSGGYEGASYIYAQDASQTLARGSAHLTPGSLGVSQGVSIDDAAESAVVSTANQDGRGAMQHAFVYDGSLDSVQKIDIDGVITTSQDTQMVGYLPTAFGTAGNIDVNHRPTNLKIEGEGAAVAVSSLDLAGPAEVDCNLATGTGNSAWAYGDIRYAESDFGAVGAAAGAGKIDLEADWTGRVPGLYIDGYGEAAAAGIGAIGVENEIKGTLAASTGDAGTAAYGEDIEASNKKGTVVAAAAAGGLGAGVNLQNGVIGGGAEAAGIGVLADGKKNEISVGTLAAGTGFFGTDAYGEDVEASNKKGTVVAAAAAGGLGAGVDLKNRVIGGGAEAAGIGVLADGKKNEISAGTLAAGTGFLGTGAYGEDVEASNKKGTVVAAAVAGGLGAEADLQNAIIGGGAEAGLVGVGAYGKNNEISAGTLAAGTGFLGTGAYGEDVEASNDDGFIVAVAGAGGLGGTMNLSNGNGTIGAEGAIFGAGAAGEENQISVGSVGAITGNSAYVVATDVNVSSTKGAAGTGAAAGNVQIDLIGWSGNLTAEGSAVGAGAIGDQAYAGADRLRAESGDGTSAAGKGLTTSVVNGVAGAGAIGATFNFNGPGSGWEVASVEGDITGTGEIRGNFGAETGQSAAARANNLFAEGNDVHLGSHAENGISSSDADTDLSGSFDGKLKAYAGDSTEALIKGNASGDFELDAEAISLDPVDYDSKHKKRSGDYDITVKAMTDDTGADAKAKAEAV